MIFLLGTIIVDVFLSCFQALRTNGTGAGNFPDDVEFPGLDFPPYDWFSTEAVLNLDLPAGYYRFGVNSDDGFQFNAIAPQGVAGAPLVLGLYDNGRAAAANRGARDRLGAVGGESRAG